MTSWAAVARFGGIGDNLIASAVLPGLKAKYDRVAQAAINVAAIKDALVGAEFYGAGGLSIAATELGYALAALSAEGFIYANATTSGLLSATLDYTNRVRGWLWSYSKVVLPSSYVEQVRTKPYSVLVTNSSYVKSMLSFRYNYVTLVERAPHMPSIAAMPPVAPAQEQTMAVDFGEFLPSGVTLTGTPTVTLSVSLGNDSTPQQRVIRSASIGTVSKVNGGSGVTSAAVLWQVGGCLPNVTYIAEVFCDRSDGDVAEASTRFACQPPS